MKRLLKKMLLFTVPFFLALVFFFLFEPYDYFAVKGNAAYHSKPLSAMRYTMLRKPDKIILGDSRMANLDNNYIREISGEEYATLGYGGSQLGESIDMFWFAVEHTELSKVVFGLNFFTSPGTQTGENRVLRVEQVEPYAKNPLKFISHINYWLETMANAKNTIQNGIARLLNLPEFEVWVEDPRVDNILPDSEMGKKWPKNIESYGKEDIYKALTGFHIEDETYAALQEIIDYCDANGIELIFVFPPVHDSIFEYVVEPLGFGGDLERYKEFLIERATVYDFELRTEFSAAQDTFYDGFHLLLDGKHLFARLLFTDTDEHPEMVERHIKDGVAIIPEHLAVE